MPSENTPDRPQLADGAVETPAAQLVDDVVIDEAAELPLALIQMEVTSA